MSFLFSCCTNGAEVDTAQEVFAEPRAFDAQPGGAYDADSNAFTCLVKREEGEWGMVCDRWGDCIQIIQVNSGKVKAYNDTVEAELQLIPGDLIVQIDGKAVHPQSLTELKHLARAEFTVVRPPRRSVKVTKEDSAQWGLKMTYQSGRSSCLRVNTINEGGVKAYNATAGKGSQVSDFDFILSVNGCQADPQKMLEVFKGCSAIELTVMRV